MRNLVLVLLAAGAVAFVGYVLLNAPSAPEPDWDPGGEDPRIGGPEKAESLRVAASRVLRKGHQEPGDAVDFAAVMQTEVLLDAATVKTGGDLLEAVEKALGDKMPIRWVSEDELQAFRDLRLDPQGAEGATKHQMPDIIEIVRSLGYVLEPRERFMIFRKMRGPDEEMR